MAKRFRFLTSGRLVDGDLELTLVGRHPADPVKKHVPCYDFAMRHPGGKRTMGTIRLRIGSTRRLYYPGHIGYNVNKRYRGHRYAARSCRLLFRLARAHGLSAVWITAAPWNKASCRTCEILGAERVETVLVPKGHEMRQRGLHRRRYCVDLTERDA